MKTPEELFASLLPPEPPKGLREDALRAARAALLARPAPDVWTRLAGSRPLRAAWAACVFLLVGAHALVSRTRSAAPPPLPGEIAAIAKLPRIDARLLPPVEPPRHRGQHS